MTLASTPALNTDNVVTVVQNAQFDGLKKTPLETAVDIFLPISIGEVGLLLRVYEGIDTTVEVGILSKSSQQPPERIVGRLTRAAVGLRVTMIIGQIGRYLETRRADWPLHIVSVKRIPKGAVSQQEGPTHLVVRTRIAPALSSRLALTADCAVDSTRLTGRLAVSRSSLKRLT